MDEGASEVLLSACILRQALIFTLRKGGRDFILHTHESFALFPLLWTCLACMLSTFNLVPALSPGLSEAHLGLVFAPQVLTWYWCLQNRGEITKSDFTAHALAHAATFVLLLTGGRFGSIIAVLVSAFAFIKRSGFPRSRPSFFWFIMLVMSLQRALAVPFFLNTWIVTACEISMMYIVKLRISKWFSYDRRLEDKIATESQEFSRSASSLEMQLHANEPRRSGPLLSFDSLSEDGSPLPSPPTGLGRTDSSSSRNPVELVRNDSIGPSRPHGSGHRRGVSTQSSGGSWAWGVAVQDFVAKSVSPPTSSGEEDDDDLA